MHNERLKQAAHKLIRAGRLHRIHCDKLVSEIGLNRNQHITLMHLVKQNKLSQKELAEHLEISTAAIAVILKKLEQDGYIHREASKSDNRYNETTITPKGLAVVEKTKDVFSKLDAKMFAGFSDEELDCLTTLLCRVTQNMTMEKKEDTQ